MAIEINLDVMMAKRKISSNELAAAIGITPANLSVLKTGKAKATKILKNIEGIAINRFTEKDVVRHKLVQDIVRAYEQYNERKKS